MNMKRVAVVVCIAIVVLLAIALLRGEKISAPSIDRAPQDIDLTGANILLITLDTTRADRLGSYGYAAAETPRLDRLANEGVLFEQAVTPTAFTLPSHSSIMTGLYPPFHGVRLNGGAALADVQTGWMNKTRGVSAVGSNVYLGKYSLVKTNLTQSCLCFCRDQF